MKPYNNFSICFVLHNRNRRRGWSYLVFRLLRCALAAALTREVFIAKGILNNTRHASLHCRHASLRCRHPNPVFVFNCSLLHRDINLCTLRQHFNK